jgi:hypothetical protein
VRRRVGDVQMRMPRPCDIRSRRVLPPHEYVNSVHCRACKSAYARARHREHPDIIRMRNRISYLKCRPRALKGAREYRERTRVRGVRRSKTLLLEMIGPFCSFCGETDPVILQFDHKVPIGHNSERGSGADFLLTRLRHGEESPFNLQTVCANDHARKTAIERVVLLNAMPEEVES